MSTENKEETFVEPIARNVGERLIITGGRDYAQPKVRVVNNTHPKAQDHEKSVYISQGELGVSLSLTTIEAIVAWAKGK